MIETCIDEKVLSIYRLSLACVFQKATCVALGETRFYSNEVVRRVVQMSYDSAHHCFNDANLLQQRCAQYRQCCPHFDM